MSAFIVGPDHLKALALFAASRSHGSVAVDPRYVKGLEQLEQYDERKLAEAYANVLYAENIRSVLHRYPTDTLETAPGLIEKPDEVSISNRDMANLRLRVKPVAILSMSNCLEYQSCETDDYEQSIAFRLLSAIRRAAIKQLPGYDDAPWEFSLEKA